MARRPNRKPVDQLSGLDSRQAVWNIVREKRRFTAREIRIETTLKTDTVRDYLKGLEAAGYLAEDGTSQPPSGQPAKAYKLVRDVGIEAPRVRRDGSEVAQGRGREQMWRTMKVLGVFSARDLAVNASTEDCPVSEVDAKYYSTYLHRAGYLAIVSPGKGTGRGGTLTRYRLLPRRYTGPRPPMIQRVRQVFDPNINEVVWRQGGDHDDA